MIDERHTKSVPILDLGPAHSELKPSLMAAFERVLDRGDFIMGADVKEFESEAARLLGVKHAVAVNSGTDALVIALRALGVGKGDVVITTPFSFFATSEAIDQVGATPRFVDIDPATFNIDPALVERAIDERVKAVIPVHLYGRAVNMSALSAICETRGIAILEDCAQSFGARWRDAFTGALGDAGAFSFFPSKTLGALGDAGLITFRDDAHASEARALRAHGAAKKYHNEKIGYNSRMDTVQAALLRVKLPHILKWTKQRFDVAQRYNELLGGLSGVTCPELVDGHVFHQYTVRITKADRDVVQKRLAEAGVSTMVYYPIPIHKLPVYAMTESLLHSERAASEVLSLPIWPEIDDETMRYVADSLRAAVQ